METDIPQWSRHQYGILTILPLDKRSMNKHASVHTLKLFIRNTFIKIFSLLRKIP